MHNSLNERFFSFNSTVVIFRNLFRNDSGIIMEKDRNLLSFGVWSGGGLSSIHLAILKGNIKNVHLKSLTISMSFNLMLDLVI